MKIQHSLYVFFYLWLCCGDFSSVNCNFRVVYSGF